MAGHNRKLKRELLNVWKGIQVSNTFISTMLKTVGGIDRSPTAEEFSLVDLAACTLESRQKF